MFYEIIDYNVERNDLDHSLINLDNVNHITSDRTRKGIDGKIYHIIEVFFTDNDKDSESWQFYYKTKEERNLEYNCIIKALKNNGLLVRHALSKLCRNCTQRVQRREKN